MAAFITPRHPPVTQSQQWARHTASLGRYSPCAIYTCRIGVFPNGEEVLVSRAGRSRVAGQNARSPQLEMGQGAGRCGLAYPAMIEDFLELGCRFLRLSCLEVSLSTSVIGYQAYDKASFVR